MLRGLDQLSFRIGMGGIVLVTVLFLLPILAVGFVGDDLNNSFINGGFAFNHSTMFNALVLSVKVWLQTQGRFFPVGMVYSLLFWHFFPNQVIEKALQLTAVVVNVLTFAVFVRMLSRSRAISIIAGIVVVGLLQIRFWYDPILSYIVLLPVTLEFVLLSAIFWLISFRTSRPVLSSGIALTVWFAGLLTYELSYGLTLINLYLIARLAPNRRQKVAGMAATVMILLAISVFDLTLRRIAHVSGGAYSIAISGAYFHALLEQLIGAVPLSYAALRPFPTIMPSLKDLLLHPSQLSLSVGVCSLVVIGFFLFRQPLEGRTERNRLMDLAVIGAILWVVPAAIISLSPRWQSELQPGLAYLAVYIEYFGVALILTAMISWGFDLLRHANRRWSELAAISVAVCISLVLYETAQSNAVALDSYFPIYTAGRANFETAARVGLFEHVPEGARIILDSSYPFTFDTSPFSPDVRYLLMMYTGRRFTALSPAAIAGTTLCRGPYVLARCPVGPGLYRYQSARLEEENSWVSVAHIVDLERLPSGLDHVHADHVWIYASGTMQDQARYVGAELIRRIGTSAGVYEMTNCEPLPSDDLSSPSLATFAYGAGFYGPEHNATGDFEWSVDRAVVTVTNNTGVGFPVTLRAELYSLAPTTLTVRRPGRTERLRVMPTGTALELPLTIRYFSTEAIMLSAQGGIRRAKGDPRTLAIRIANPRITLRWCKNGLSQNE